MLKHPVILYVVAVVAVTALAYRADQAIAVDKPYCTAYISPSEDGSWTSGALVKADGTVVDAHWGEPGRMPKWGWTPALDGHACPVTARL